MIEVTGNLWTFPADVRVITTNGSIKTNGDAVMGRGCALEAAQKWPILPKSLGHFIKARGNRVVIITEIEDGKPLVVFPVKHEWREKADGGLIQQSAYDLEKLATYLQWKVVVLPRPGCGNGGLRWESVKQILDPILDDRFHVITHGENPS